MPNANRLTLFVSETCLQFALWDEEKCLYQQKMSLEHNYLEAYFPFWQKLVKHPLFSWKAIKTVYCLNGPNKFALLRTLLVNLKLYRLLHSQWNFYVLNHLAFQVATSKLTISLITANKNHYYCGFYQNFRPLKPLQLLPKAALNNHKLAYSNAVIVQDFQNADLLSLWKSHWKHFRRLAKTDNLTPFYLNPFSLDKIKQSKDYALFPSKNRT